MLRSLFLASLIGVSGCSSPGELSFVTYNAGLAVGFVPAANERSPLTAAAIAGLDADVICIQEVFQEEHVADLVSATETSHPYRYLPQAQQVSGEAPGCLADDLDPVISCMEASCGDLCIDDVPVCLLENCGLQFLGLDRDCMRCVQANVGGTATEVESTCLSESTEYAYGGAYGTGILSKHPILATDALQFPATTTNRSLLHAVVDLPGGAADVYCTHLTPVFAVIPFPRTEGSWAEEQRQQIEEMLSYIDETATHDRVVLAGDMNTGPSLGESRGEYEEHYSLLAGAFSHAPYVEDGGSCTFCPTNPINSADSDEDARLIDHVFLEGFSGELRSERLLDGPIDTETCGEPISAALSDHYAVSVWVE